LTCASSEIKLGVVKKEWWFLYLLRPKNFSTQVLNCSPMGPYEYIWSEQIWFSKASKKFAVERCIFNLFRHIGILWVAY